MLRSITNSSKLAYSCLCLNKQWLQHVPRPHTGERCLHTTPAFCMDKDLYGKKHLIKLNIDKRLANLEVKGSLDPTLKADDASSFPTIDTPGMLVNGVCFSDLHIINMHCSPNNTIIVLTDSKGKTVLGRTSCGKEGFRNAKKSSTVAAQATGMAIGYTARKHGVEYARVILKGIGSGRMPALRGLRMSGVKVVSITDRTTIMTNGPRPKKARRL